MDFPEGTSYNVYIKNISETKEQEIWKKGNLFNFKKNIKPFKLVDDKQMTIGQLKMKMGCFLTLVPHSEDSTFQSRIMTRKPSFEPNCKLELGDVVDVLQISTVKLFPFFT